MAVQLTSAAHLLLYDEDDALLMIRRFNTGYCGIWTAGAGDGTLYGILLR